MNDRLSHWLQGGALVAAFLGLYIASKRGPGPVQAAEDAPLPTNPVSQFGNATAPGTTQYGGVNVGGSPFYLTYNFPGQNTNPSGIIAGNPPNPPVTTSTPVRRRKSDSCCGCDSGCNPQQFTLNDLGTDNLTALASRQSIAARRPSPFNNIRWIIG